MSYFNSIQKAIDYIENDVGVQFDLYKIAEEATMSLPHLYRIFYSLTGHPIKDYIRKRRISVAAEHLRNSNRSLLDIALEVGFESHASFSKTFKKIVGMSPGAYRKTELNYCFEKINLFEKVIYLEDKELSERYPDVKVITLAPMKVLTYRHISNTTTGIEREALQETKRLLKQFGLHTNKTRFLGYNIEPDSKQQSYGYEIMVPIEENLNVSIETMKIDYFQGGLYAIRATPSDCDKTIIAAWNVLLSEWLPKSTFIKGTHTYLEEFNTYNEKIVRMKLHLPIKRKIRPDMISITDVSPFSVAYYKEYGSDASERADLLLTRWLESSEYPNDLVTDRLYVSYYYGSSHDDEHWHEYGVSIKDSDKRNLTDMRVKGIGGGTFACMETKAYGSLTGVLEMMHRWIVSDQNYLIDDERQWFAEYQTSTLHANEEDIRVICYIPVITDI